MNDAAVEGRRIGAPEEGAVVERSDVVAKSHGCKKLSQKTDDFRCFHHEFRSGRQGDG